MLDSILEFFWNLFPPCLVRVYQKAVGLAYGDPKFDAIVTPYWTRGYGTTCAVVLTWALEQCRWPGPLNRGPGWKVGAHMAPILDYARAQGMVIDSPPLQSLRPGDIVYLQGSKPEDWHVGVVEKNHYPSTIVTLDGGQSDSRGEQSIGRVSRAVVGEMLGPKPRRVAFVIRPRKTR